MVAYYQFIKTGIGRIGPRKKELKLKYAQCCTERTSNPSVVQKAFLDMPNAVEFYTLILTSRKPRSLDCRNASLICRILKPTTRSTAVDTMKFSCPCASKRITRSCTIALPTIVEDAFLSMQDVTPPSLAELSFHQIIVVQESKVNEKLWHIACLLHTSIKSY